MSRSSSGFLGITDVRALGALALTVVVWASAFSATRLALTDLSPAHVSLIRYAVASFVLAVYALATRMPLPRLRDVPAILGLGLVGIAGYNVTLSYGQAHVP